MIRRKRSGNCSCTLYSTHGLRQRYGRLLEPESVVATTSSRFSRKPVPSLFGRLQIHDRGLKSSAGSTPSVTAIRTTESSVAFVSPRSISEISARRISARSARSDCVNPSASLRSRTFRPRVALSRLWTFLKDSDLVTAPPRTRRAANPQGIALGPLLTTCPTSVHGIKDSRSSQQGKREGPAKWRRRGSAKACHSLRMFERRYR